MRFKINEIGDEGLALDVSITAEWLAAACPDLDARPGMAGLSLRGALTCSGDDYLLRADLRGVLEMACGRCLEPARLPIDVPMMMTFVSGDDADGEDQGPDVVVFPGGEIDISDEVRDEIVLAIPLGPVCSETCRGLCPVCGGNRNLTACDCEERQRQGQSKFAELAKLKI
jgi:uncharacterized protein